MRKNLLEEEVIEALKYSDMMVKSIDYAEFEQWMTECPPGRIRDRAIRELSNSKPLPGHDMSRVMELAQKVEHEDKNALTENILKNWVEMDESAALQWLDSPQCPESKRNEWKDKLSKRTTSLFQ